jgi:hypothetical protein
MRTLTSAQEYRGTKPLAELGWGDDQATVLNDNGLNIDVSSESRWHALAEAALGCATDATCLMGALGKSEIDADWPRR